MALAEFLDAAIRKSEEGKVASCYEIEGKKPYENYLSNDAWDAFRNGMSKEHREQFGKGGGSELKENRGRWGIYPPKMASFGSSSRFVYNLLERVYGEEFDRVEFEKKLRTRVGGVANLDAYIKSICEIFIEAKCHEIYSSHNSTEINECYERVFEDLASNLNWFRYCNVGDSTKTNYSKYSFYYNDKQIKRFDIKQLICHFLGISAYILESGEKHNIKFVYLIYNPSDVVKEDNAEGTKILQQHQATLDEIVPSDMEKLFADIFEYQKENLNKDYSGDYDHFEFVIADQSTIEEHLK